MPKDCILRTRCRICDKSDFVKILDLGKMPSANAFLKEEELSGQEKKFPLVVYFCGNCGLLQLLDVVNPSILFKHYDYLTSASKPLAQHFLESGKQLVKKFGVLKDDLVIEIGGNDGILLANIKDVCRVLNIEPADNIAPLSRQRGVETINSFFSSSLAEKILKDYGRASLIIANNVFAHIDDLKDVMRGIKKLLGDKGIFVFEVHWVGNLIGEGGFDQIYHEHLCYFSLHALLRLMQEQKLEIFDVELIPIHGQSMRVYVGKKMGVSGSVNRFLKTEKNLGLNSAETFLKFAEKTKNNKEKLLNFLLNLRGGGKTIAGYGAPAKGNTLLNYCGIDGKILDFIVDTTPLKQGLYTPGSHIRIWHPDKLKEFQPDYLLLLAWNYADMIIANEAEYRKKGGKFIIPVPEVKVV